MSVCPFGRHAVVLGVVLGVLSCKSGQATEPGEGPAKQAAVAATPQSAAQPSGQAFAEPAVRALVERWLAAQNAGAFEQYQPLYAERFTGIRRSGDVVRRFARDPWMSDRRRMFNRPMRVAVSDLRVTSGCCNAVASFTQSWASEKYQDEGPKELVLVDEGGQLKIASEIMLRSNVKRRSDPSTALMLVVWSETRPYVVLASQAGEPAAHGKLRLEDKGGDQLVTAPIADSALPAEFAGRRGRAVDVYGATQRACSAKLGELRWLRRLITTAIGSDEQAPKPTPAQAAQSAWEMAGEPTLVAAELTDAQGDCRGALWARDASTPPPELFVLQEPSAEQRGGIERAARTTPAYRRAAAEYASFKSKQAGAELAADWERFDDAEPRYQLWVSPSRTLASFSGSTGGCSDFGAAVDSVFELRGDRFVLLGDAYGNDRFRIGALLDADRDGAIELVGTDGWSSPASGAAALKRLSEHQLRAIDDISPPFHGCGC